ncbi:MAG: hypothetical protein ACRD27_10570 [Terracidiphilus sp.]
MKTMIPPLAHGERQSKACRSAAPAGADACDGACEANPAVDAVKAAATIRASIRIDFYFLLST